MARLVSPEPSDLEIRHAAVEIAIRWDPNANLLGTVIERAAIIEDYLRNGKQVDK